MKSKKYLWFIIILLAVLITSFIAIILEMCGFGKTEYEFKNTNVTVSEFITVLKKERFEVFSEMQSDGSDRLYTQAQKDNLHIEVWYDKDKLIDIFEVKTENPLGFSDTEYGVIESMLNLLMEDDTIANSMIKSIRECFASFTKKFEFKSIEENNWSLGIDKLDKVYSVMISQQICL